jgi:hypothetical protein
LSLADFGGAATSAEMQTAFKRLWSITESQQVGMLLMQS